MHWKNQRGMNWRHIVNLYFFLPMVYLMSLQQKLLFGIVQDCDCLTSSRFCVSFCFHFRPFLRTIWHKSWVTALKFRFILRKSSESFFYSRFTVGKCLSYVGARPECIFVTHPRCRYWCQALYLEEQTHFLYFEMPEITRKNKNYHDLE